MVQCVAKINLNLENVILHGSGDTRVQDGGKYKKPVLVTADSACVNLS